MTIAFREIVRKAIELHRRAADEIGTQSVEDLRGQIGWVEPAPPTPTQVELRDYLLNQPVAAVYALIVLMYLGSGAFPVTDVLEQFEIVEASFHQPSWAVSQMMEKPLADYLERGLQKLANAGSHVESLLDRYSVT